MSNVELIIAAILLSAISGLPALVLPSRSPIGQPLAILLNVAGCLVGLFGVWTFFQRGVVSDTLRFASPLSGFDFSFSLDGLSAFFVVPIFLIGGLASVYSLHYWPHRDRCGGEPSANARRVSLFLGAMTSAMTVLVIARDGITFLFGWEVMAVSAFFLVAAEAHLPETRRAAWIYMAASHLATVCVLGVFSLLYAQTGSFDFATLPESESSAGIAIAVLAFVGFGTKAGLMPMHVWLPGAHGSAPSHVSAIMSGVMLKMGLYGIFRVASFFPSIPLSWGMIVLVVGSVSAVLGVVFAISQRDLKRLLAYSSIENVGIITMGLGVALIGRAVGRSDWVLLGMCGSLLHVWNHALFKSLLFFVAGSVIHAMQTRDLDVMGGLGRRMPVTANCFLIGAVAICGLPPLCGFVSEWFIYMGLFSTITSAGSSESASLIALASLAAPALALVGALAVACFVKVYGIAFLGLARSEDAEKAHESGTAMLIPMLVLSAFCILIGAMPTLFTQPLEVATAVWVAADTEIAASVRELRLLSLVPLGRISIIAVMMIVFMCAGTLGLIWRTRTAATTGTWDCGYAAPSSRMQYSSSSFAGWLVELFAWALRPLLNRPKIDTLFPADTMFESHVGDTVLERLVEPVTSFTAWMFGLTRYFQQGSLQAYLLYILVIVIGLMLWQPGA